MIHVNLLPPELRRVIEKPRIVSLRFVMVMTFLLALFFWMGLSFTLGTSKRELENMTSNSGVWENQSEEADAIMTRINSEYVERKKVMNLILETNITWSLILNQVSDSLPDTVWLKRIRLSSSPAGQWELMIRGVSLTPAEEPAIKSIGRFAGALKPAFEKSGFLKNAPEAKPRMLETKTSTDQKSLSGIPATFFDVRFFLKEKEDESVRDQPGSEQAEAE